MKRSFIVGVREIHVRHYSVQAKNEEEAKDLVDQRAASVTDLDFQEFSHEMPKDTWSVEEIPDKNDSAGQPGHNTEDAQS
jgi:hypothetical protein